MHFMLTFRPGKHFTDNTYILDILEAIMDDMVINWGETKIESFGFEMKEGDGKHLHYSWEIILSPDKDPKKYIYALHKKFRALNKCEKAALKTVHCEDVRHAICYPLKDYVNDLELIDMCNIYDIDDENKMDVLTLDWGLSGHAMKTFKNHQDLLDSVSAERDKKEKKKPLMTSKEWAEIVCSINYETIRIIQKFEPKDLLWLDDYGRVMINSQRFVLIVYDALSKGIRCKGLDKGVIYLAQLLCEEHPIIKKSN